MRGRKTKPVDLHIIEGTFNSTKHGKAISAPAKSGSPVPPYKLKSDQRKLWDQFTRLLWWNGEAESELLMLYINLTIDRRKHEKGLACKYSWTPALMGRYTQIGAELGIGYAQRQKVPAKGQDDEEEDFD